MNKKILLLSLFTILFLFFLTDATAQSREITGTVKDEQGNPLIGASVSVKGTQLGTNTNESGQFRLGITDADEVLVFRYVGMNTQEIPIGDRSFFDVTLQSGVSGLDEVVVIGYGSQRRGDVNGAISSITSEQLTNVPQANVDQMLQGKVAGVTVTNNSGQPGAGISVRVRGITSFSGSEPLYVIDGVAIDGNASSQISSNDPNLNGISPGEQEQTPSVLAHLNPNDIESIDILKDASATAIYGSRGSNGVVIITTKSGTQRGGKINFDSYYGFQEQGKFIKMMNLPQYAAFENMLADEYGLTRRADFVDPEKLGPGTNWQDAIFRRSFQTNNTLTFSGKGDRSDYYVSGSYFKQEGTIIGSDYQRYSMHVKLNSQVKEYLKIGTSLSGSNGFQNNGLGNTYGIIYNALLQSPDVAVYNADGTFAGPVLNADGLPQGGRNPIQQALSITNNLTRNNVQGRVYGDIVLPDGVLKGLTLHSEINGNFNWNRGKIFNPTYAYGATGASPAFENTLAVLEESNTHDSYWNWLEHLNYSKTFGKHYVQALAGREVWRSDYGGIIASTKGFTAGNTIQTLNLGTQETNTLDEPKGSTTMESYLARVIYTFDDKYSITANGRRDRSSNFAPGHQVGYFYGFSGSWRISEENFLKDNDVLSNLRLRAGYGTTGNSNVPQYSYGSSIGPVTTGVGTGFKVNNFPNLDLTWETAIQTNIGLDFGFFNGRLEGAVDYYIKSSKDFLFQQPLPAFLAGGEAEFSSNSVVNPPWVNAGKIENTGIDVNITSQNIVNRDFSWKTSVILSHYTNKVVSLNNFPALDGIVSTGFGPQVFATKTLPGGPIGQFYGYKMEGIITTQEQLNDLIAHPQNVIGKAQPVSSDRSVADAVWLGDILYAGNQGDGSPNKMYALGNPNPKLTYSISNTFSYKNFDLFIFLNGSYGGKIFNAVSLQTMGMYGLYMNQRQEVAQFWTEDNPNSKIPAPRSGFGNNNLVMSDRFLENASFLKIQNVRIGYTLPSQWSEKIAMASLKVFFSGQNLHVFTKYSGLDPEIGSWNQNPILQNVDYGRYPSPRVITFGINAEF